MRSEMLDTAKKEKKKAEKEQNKTGEIFYKRNNENLLRMELSQYIHR